MWNIFKKSNKAKAEQQRNLAVAHMRSSLDDIYKNRSKLIKNSPWPKKYEVLPSWVEKYEGFNATAWVVDKKKRTNTMVNLVTYVPSPTTMERPFAKIVFTENDVPFKQMNNLCSTIAKYNKDEVELHGTFVDKPYSMGTDGKIRDKTGDFLPDSHLISCVIDDLYLSYEDWRRFPDVESAKLVAKLTFAWKDVEKMQNEEHSGRIKNEIDEIRRSIKSSQERISELESAQNEMYEKAADALNLLEEYGYDLAKIEKFQKKDFEAMVDLPTELLQKLSGKLNLPLKALNGYNNAQDQYALAP